MHRQRDWSHIHKCMCSNKPCTNKANLSQSNTEFTPTLRHNPTLLTQDNMAGSASLTFFQGRRNHNTSKNQYLYQEMSHKSRYKTAHKILCIMIHQMTPGTMRKNQRGWSLFACMFRPFPSSPLTSDLITTKWRPI